MNIAKPAADITNSIINIRNQIHHFLYHGDVVVRVGGGGGGVRGIRVGGGVMDNGPGTGALGVMENGAGTGALGVMENGAGTGAGVRAATAAT